MDPKTKVIKYFLEKANYEEMRSSLGSVEWNHLLENRTVNEKWDIISRRLRMQFKNMFQATKVEFSNQV